MNPESNTSKRIREKSHRLEPANYKGETAVFFTAVIQNHVSLFVDQLVVGQFVTMLEKSARKYLCKIPVYLFMPDHVHLVLEGRSEESNVLEAMKLFKQLTGFWLSKSRMGVRWQKDFYDHIVRDDESLENIVEYIIANPVRKGIVEDWKDYPYKGSTEFDFSNWD